jgi:hypothetical protein
MVVQGRLQILEKLIAIRDKSVFVVVQQTRNFVSALAFKFLFSEIHAPRIYVWTYDILNEMLSVSDYLIKYSGSVVEVIGMHAVEACGPV